MKAYPIFRAIAEVENVAIGSSIGEAAGAAAYTFSTATSENTWSQTRPSR
ncbi:MAG: hypothetical protein LBS53_10175 [Synergistaceae bacterium]|nr:hypothetical protein [Synergistaceae bacterium]